MISIKKQLSTIYMSLISVCIIGLLFLFVPTDKTVASAYTEATAPVEPSEPDNSWNDILYRELSDGTLELYGYSGKLNANLIMPETINGKSVTKIAKNAFKGNTDIVSVTIPENMKEICSGAFYGCENLKTISFNAIDCNMGGIPEQNVDSVFGGCSNVEQINIGNNVTRIPDFAFIGIKQLDTFTIPESVTNIGAMIFDNTTIGELLYNVTDCKSLGYVYINSIDEWVNEYIHIYPFTATKIKRIIIGNNVEKITNGIFNDQVELTSLILGDNLKSIDGFSGCSSLTEVIIPDSVTTIEGGAFKNCSGLSKITLPSSIKRIESAWRDDYNSFTYSGAFEGCSNLKYIDIPDNVEYVGEFTFKNCESLEKVTIGKGLKTINAGTFYNCTNLTEVTIPDTVTWINNQHNYGSYGYVYTGAFEKCSSLKSIHIPGSIEDVDAFTFRDCTSLEKVTIGEGVESIESGAFYNCVSLKDIDIPNSVQEINSYYFADYDRGEGGSEDEYHCGAFEGCINLKEITLGKNIVYIDDRALGFYYDEDYYDDFSEFPGAYIKTGLTIYGYVNSDAERYANEYNIIFEKIQEQRIVGDVDGDNSISILDATYIQRYIAKLDDFTESQLSCADTDGDGKVSILDATKIQRILAGLISNL